MTCLTAHTYTHTCTARSNPLCSPNVQYSRIPSALRRWWRAKKNSNNKKWCGAVSHSLMTSPQSYAALIFPLLHVHHTHTQWDTHTHRERERHCPPHLRPLLLLLLQPTHTTWGMYREDTTLHITHLHKPNLELGPCAHTNLGKCIFVNRKELLRYSTELKITIHLLSH